jgi:type II secretory pathway pseudopilin PulG
MAAIAIITAIALPPLVRERIADREAEVKANIHQIQIALERYAVDSGGFYPQYLVGAERSSNILQCYLDSGPSSSSWPTSGMTAPRPHAQKSRAFLRLGTDDSKRL